MLHSERKRVASHQILVNKESVGNRRHGCLGRVYSEHDALSFIGNSLSRILHRIANSWPIANLSSYLHCDVAPSQQ